MGSGILTTDILSRLPSLFYLFNNATTKIIERFKTMHEKKC